MKSRLQILSAFNLICKRIYSKRQFLVGINYLVKKMQILCLYLDLIQWVILFIGTPNLSLLAIYMFFIVKRLSHGFSQVSVIHSGCAVGLQSELGNSISIDISDLIIDTRDCEAISTALATHRPNSLMNYFCLSALPSKQVLICPSSSQNIIRI